MKSVLHLALIGFFASNWFSTGGLVVRYPMLEKMLARISVQYPDIAQNVRSHTAPSTMCSAHAVVESAPASALGPQNPSVFSPALLPIKTFLLMPAIVSHRRASQSAHLPAFFDSAVRLQPPRLAA